MEVDEPKIIVSADELAKDASNNDDQQNATHQQEELMTTTTDVNQRALNKSKRWWKKIQTNRPLVTTKPKSSWEKKMKERSMHKQVRTMQEEIRQKLAEEKAQKSLAKKEKEERRKQNELKSEVVQVIKNPAKLKRMKKKQLKMVKRRDITEVKK